MISVTGLPIWRTVYLEGVYMSVVLFSLGHGSTSFRYQMVFVNFYLEIITPSNLCDV